MLDVGEARTGGPSGEADAIVVECLEDRGGGLPGQDGVGVDCSGAAHWCDKVLWIGWCSVVVVVVLVVVVALS